MKMWRVIVRMSFNRDGGSGLRNQLDKILKDCGIEYAKNTGTWEGPKVTAAAAASQLQKVFRHLAEHYQWLDKNGKIGPKVEHLWLYIDRAKIPKTSAQPATPAPTAQQVTP